MINTLRNARSHHAVAQERLDGGHVKGSVVRGHIDWVRDHRDRDEVIAFFEAIPRAMRSVVASSWYSFGDVIELDRVIVNRFGHGQPDVLCDLGSYVARTSLEGIHRFFQRSGVHEFFRRSALSHPHSLDFGFAKYGELGPTQGRMVHRAYTSFSPLYCASTIGFYRECIRMHGGLDVDAWESHCQCHGDSSCTFELFWS